MKKRNEGWKCCFCGMLSGRGVLLLAVFLAAALSAQMMSAAELVIDDFEGEELVCWDVGGADKPFKLTINTDPAFVKTGKQSLKVECRYLDKKHSNLCKYFSNDPEKTSWLKPTSETDTLSFWIYVEKVTGEPNMTVLLGARGERGILRGKGFNIIPSGTWQRITIPPDQWNSGAEKAKELWEHLYCFSPVIHGEVTFYIDDLKFISPDTLETEVPGKGSASADSGKQK